MITHKYNDVIWCWEASIIHCNIKFATKGTHLTDETVDFHVAAVTLLYN